MAASQSDLKESTSTHTRGGLSKAMGAQHVSSGVAHGEQGNDLFQVIDVHEEDEAIDQLRPGSTGKNERSEGNAVDSSKPLTTNQRLAMKQLDRFRKALVKNNQRKSRWSAKTTNDAAPEFDNLFGTSSCPLRQVKFASYPWPTWIFGGLLIGATSVFIHQVHKENLRSVHGEKHDWWKYLVGIAVYILAVALMANARVDTVHLSKDDGRVYIKSTKPLCFISHLRRERNVNRELREIREVRVEATGEFSGEVDTRCYRVCFEFMDGTITSTLESRSKRKANKRSRIIKYFLLSTSSSSSASKTNLHNDKDEDAVEQSVESED